MASVWDGPGARVQPERAGEAAGAVGEVDFWDGAVVDKARQSGRAERSPRQGKIAFFWCTFIRFPQGLKPHTLLLCRLRHD